VAGWRFRIDADREQAVVLAIFWYPDWRATLDGVPVRVAPRATSAYAEFSCPPGEHVFEGAHVASALRRGVGWFSAAAALLTLALLRRRRDALP
jgi:hypothetical protein